MNKSAVLSAGRGDRAQRIWALVSGFPRRERAARAMAMLQAYVDDSGTGQPPVFVLAGFVASTDRWAEFSDAWDDVLKEAPGIAYFKMKEAAECREGEFKGWRHADRDEKVRRL